MLRPEAMTFVEIVCPADIHHHIIDILHECGHAEIEDSNRVADTPIRNYLFPETDLNRARELIKTAEDALDTLGAAYDVKTPTNVAISETMHMSESLLGHAGEIIAEGNRLKQIRDSITMTKDVNALYRWLSSIGIEKSLLRDSERISIILGMISAKHLPALLSDKQSFLTFSKPIRGKIFIIALCPQIEEDTTDDFQRIQSFIPISLSAAVENISELKEEEKKMRSVLASFRKEIPSIQKALGALRDYINAAEQIRRCGLTDHCAHIAVWIPTRFTATTFDRIRALHGNNCIIYETPAETTIEEKLFTYEDVPSHLRPSHIFDPFRIIVSAYSWLA
ncbi:MAG TPA: hypothetical protein VF857_09050, partial [Spirochaetota bacterium]